MVRTTEELLAEQRRRLAAILEVLEALAAGDSEPILERIDDEVVAQALTSISEKLRGTSTSIPRASEGDDVASGGYGPHQDRADVARLEDKLAQAKKMEGLGLLASGVAHDFNNVLMGILGSTHIAIDALGDPARARHFLHESIRAAESGAAIANQILAFARKSDAPPELIDLHEVITDTLPLLARLLGNEIECVVETNASQHHVFLNHGNVEQVLVNLAVNARDAMGCGGNLAIETRSHQIKDDDPRCTTRFTPGKYVVLQVEDTGTGMSEDVQRRIFDPFFTTKHAGKGTGLGLSTIFGIVGQARGHIEVQSVLEQGTTFTIFLPCLPPPETPRATQPGHGQVPG